MERARDAIASSAAQPQGAREQRYVFWIEFEATDEDMYALRDFTRLLDSFEGRYFTRKGTI